MISEQDFLAGYLIMGKPGVWYQRSPNNAIDTYTASSALPFGIMVAIDGDRGAKALTSSGEALAGVLLYDGALDVGSLGSCKSADLVAVMGCGKVLVAVEEAVVKGDDCYVRYSGEGTRGAFSASPGSGKRLVRGVFLTSQAMIGGLAVLSFRV